MEAPVGAAVAATISLLAFILAFTFSLAATRFEERRRLVLEESNAIGTTYLRAEYLAEPNRSKIKSLLRDYTSYRLAAVQPGKLQEALTKSEQLQDLLWSQTVQVAEKAPTSVMAGLFVQSLNDVIDIHAKRVLIGLRSRLPETIWLTLFSITFLAIAALGYHNGLTGARCLIVNTALVLTFSGVILLIADLDRSQEGALKVSQQSMKDLYDKLNSQKPSES